MVAWAVLAIAAQPLPPSWRSYPREFRYPVEEAIGHAFRDGRAPGDLMGTPILGALGYYARPARVEDEYGLIEPEVALSHRRAYPFGKYLPGYLIGLHPSMLVYDSWMDLGRAVSEGSDSYTAFVGDQMNRAGIFVAVRSDTVGRFGPLLASRLGARPVPLDTALAEWRLAYPRFA